MEVDLSVTQGWHSNPIKSVCVCVCVLVIQSCLTLCDPMDCSPKAPLSVEFSRRDYWGEMPFSSTGDLPDPGMEPRSPALQADSLPSEPPYSYMNK